MILQEVLQKSTLFLKQKSFLTPRLDAELLLSEALGLKRIDLYTQFEKTLTSKELDLCRSWVQRRGQGEPVAYITGKKNFYLLEFDVTPDVLIPRPATELLVDLFLKNVPQNLEKLSSEAHSNSDLNSDLNFKPENKRPLRFIDMGTGSGCIALSILHQIPHARALMVDASEPALQVARKNAEKWNLESRCEFAQIDLNLPSQEIPWKGVDAIVANPPYIDQKKKAHDVFVEKFEPPAALFADQEGLFSIARWMELAKHFLCPGGFVFFEIGYDQGNWAKGHLEGLGFKNVLVEKDLEGHDRVVWGKC